MKIGSMLEDVVHALFQQPVTQQYPFERTDTPSSLRGKLHWNSEKCTGCQLCVKDCPAQALKVFMIDKAKKQFVMRYQVDRCTFCSQCVVSCRTNALEMSSTEWELASGNQDDFTIYYGDEAHVRQLVQSDEPDSEQSERE